MARAIVPKKDAAESSNAPVTEGKPAKRRCVSSACVPCRKRKSKCDGGTPVCATCIAVYKTECFYDAESESRRAKAVPQKRDATVLKDEGTSSSSQILIEALKTLPEYELQGLIHQIRVEDNLDALAESLKKDAATQSNQGSTSQHDENLSAYMGKVSVLDTGVSRVFGPTSGMGIVMEDDNDTGYRPSAVRKHETWTSVTRDQEFVEHCMQQYFEITHQFYMFFPQKYFWQSYRNGDSKYCSPLLVNAICALGCHSSDRPDARTNPNDPRTAGDHFFAEARRHLFEDETPSLTTVQALAVMGLREPGTGRDSAGFMYAGRCIRMALELGLHLKHPGPGAPDPIEDEICRVTFWSCFTFDTMWTLCIGRISQLPRAATTAEKPPVPTVTDGKRRRSQHEADASIHEDSLESRQLLYHLALLSELVNDNVFMFYAPRERFTAKHLLDYYSRYKAWYRSLPPSFHVDETNNQPPPSRAILEMLMWYNACVLMLFRPLLKVTLTNSEVNPQDVCRGCANEISRLMRIYRDIYGFQRVNVALSHMNLSAATIHLLNVSTPASRDNLVQTMRDLEAVSPCVHFAARSFRIVCALSKEWGIELPPEVLATSKIVTSPTLMSLTSDSQFFLSLNTAVRNSNSREQSYQHSQIPLPYQHPPHPQQPNVSNAHVQSANQSTSPSSTYQPPTSYPYTPSYSSSDPRSPPTTNQPAGQYQQPMLPPPMIPQSTTHAPQTHSYRPAGAPGAPETSVAEQFFWHPFGGHSMPLLGTNMNVSPMALDNLLGNGDQWEQLSRDGFSFNEWNGNGVPHVVHASNGGYAQTTQATTTHPNQQTHHAPAAVTSGMKADAQQATRGEDYYGFGSW